MEKFLLGKRINLVQTCMASCVQGLRLSDEYCLSIFLCIEEDKLELYLII